MQSTAADVAPVESLIGSVRYIPTLSARIHAQHSNLPLDTVVLQSLLLCLVARIPDSFPKSFSRQSDTCRSNSSISQSLHLILRTRPEDVSIVAHIASMTLTNVFGLSTQRHKFGRHHSTNSASSAVDTNSTTRPDAILRAMFFPPTRKRSHRPRPSAELTTGSTWSSRTQMPDRSTTYPVSPISPSSSLPESAFLEARSYLSEDAYDGESIASSRRPMRTSITPVSTLRTQRPVPDRTRTEPLALASLFAPPDPERSVAGMSTRPALPQAVVVSGLERIGAPAQRALMRVLGDGKLVLHEPDDTGATEGTWNLPQDFFLVYVCKWDGYERPNIMRGLLDKFAMSADVILESSTRQAYASYRSSSISTPHPSPYPSPCTLPSDLLSTPVGTPTSTLRSPLRASVVRTSTPAVPPVVPPAELELLRALARPEPSTRAYAYTSTQSSLRVYLLDLFAAARHHPELDGTFLTQRAHTDAEALVRAYRVLVGDSIGAELVQATAVEDASEASEEDEYNEGSDEEDMEWAKSDAHWMQSQGSNSEEHAIRLNMGGDMEQESSRGKPSLDQYPVKAILRDTGKHILAPTMGQERPQVWDVSEVDVARVFPRVVSHRLRVRNGPEHEILSSVVFTAAHIPVSNSGSVDYSAQESVNTSPKVDGQEKGRKTVKELLVRILAEV